MNHWLLIATLLSAPLKHETVVDKNQYKWLNVLFTKIISQKKIINMCIIGKRGWKSALYCTGFVLKCNMGVSQLNIYFYIGFLQRISYFLRYICFNGDEIKCNVFWEWLKWIHMFPNSIAVHQFIPGHGCLSPCYNVHY